jgi:hypothetical protein
MHFALKIGWTWLNDTCANDGGFGSGSGGFGLGFGLGSGGVVSGGVGSGSGVFVTGVGGSFLGGSFLGGSGTAFGSGVVAFATSTVFAASTGFGRWLPVHTPKQKPTSASPP